MPSTGLPPTKSVALTYPAYGRLDASGVRHLAPASFISGEVEGNLVEPANPLGISVHDHIIVGKNGHASLKGLKLI